jgi:Domain of unknown function (DUF4055)
MAVNKDTIGKEKSEYKEMMVDWLRIEPLMAGATAVRSNITNYIHHAYTGETTSFYNLRCLFLSFTPIYRHFVRLSAAIISRKPLRLEGDKIPPNISEWLVDIDLRGNCVDVFFSLFLESLFGYGRAGILVEAPRKDRSRSRADDVGLRPWWVAVRPMDLPYWQHDRIDGREVLAHARFINYRSSEDDDGNDVEIEQRRVYDLADGMVMFSLWEQSDGEWELVEETDIDLPYIPYFEPSAFQSFGSESFVVIPPFLDMAGLNISHTNLSTNLDYSLNTNALPRLKRTQQVQADFPIDPTRYEQNKRPDIDASPEKIIDLPPGYDVAFFAPPTGVHADIASRKTDLEATAARYWLTTIATQKNVAETEGAKIIDREQGSSMLATVAISVEDCLNNALRCMRDYSDRTQVYQPMSYKLCVNRKFELGQMTRDVGQLLSDMAEKGQISNEELKAELVAGGLLASVE